MNRRSQEKNKTLGERCLFLMSSLIEVRGDRSGISELLVAQNGSAVFSKSIKLDIKSTTFF